MPSVGVRQGGESPRRDGSPGTGDAAGPHPSGAAAPDASFDVFLSYSRADADAVMAVAQHLRGEGLSPWLDVWCTTAGTPWQEDLARGLERSQACAVFIGPGDARDGGAPTVSDWAREELRVAVNRAATDPSFRVFLVLLPGVPEPFDPSALLPFLSMRTWVDLRRGVAHRTALQDLLHAVRGLPFGAPATSTRDDDVCPYLGLATFSEDDAEFFYGRDAEVQRLVEKLKSSAFVAVFGPSGSGKSSLVRAGVVPAVRAGAVPGGERWTIRTLTPGSRPLDALAAHLADLDPSRSLTQVRDELAADSRTLRLMAARGERLLLVVDQLEEMFTLCPRPDERRQLVGNLLEATAPGTRCSVVATMRADFYPRLAAHPQLAQRVAEHQMLVGPMSRSHLRQVVEAPARSVGLDFEPGLVDTILDDVGDEASALPLLEHALLELWRRRLGGVLTLEGYIEAGGVAGALAQRAEETWDDLTPAQQEAARRIMLRLTRPGEGVEDTRQRAVLSDLVTVADESATVEGVVRDLAAARLLAVNVDLRTTEVLVDVTHEALIRGWPRLQGWIAENRDGLRLLQRVTQGAKEWDELGRDEGALFRGARLAAALEWAETAGDQLNEMEREFLAASEAAHEEELAAQRREARLERERAERQEAAARRLRALAAGLGVVLVVALAAAAVAWRQTRLVQAAARQAVARSVAEQVVDTLSRRPDLALLLSLEALERSRAPDVQRAVLATALSTARLDALLLGHTDGVRTVEASPASYARRGPSDAGSLALDADGPVRVVATTGIDGSVRLWDVGTGRQIGGPLHEGDAQGWSVAFSADGTTLAASDADGGIALWDVASRRRTGTLRGHDDDVYTVRFHPTDPMVLASASADGTLRLWDLATQTATATVRAHGAAAGSAPAPPTAEPAAGTSVDEVLDVAFRPDGSAVMSSGRDGTVRWWSVPDGAPVGDVLVAYDAPVTDVEYVDADGRFVTGSTDGRLRVWMEGDPDPVADGPDHRTQVYAVAVSPDGWVASGGLDGRVRVWNPADGTERDVGGIGHDGAVLSLTVDPLGRLVTAGDDAVTAVWDAGPTLPASLGAALTGRRLVAGAGGLVVGDGSGTVSWLDRDLSERVAVPAHAGPVTGLDAITAAGGEVAVASGGADGVVRLWDADGAVRSDPLRHDAAVTSVALDASGDVLVTGAADGVLRVWDAATGEPRAESAHGDALWAVAVSPGGRYVASAGGLRHALLWDLETASDGGPLAEPVTLRGAVAHTSEVAAVAFAPDGGRVATGGYDGRVVVWTVPGGESRQMLRRVDARVTALAFGDEGDRLAGMLDDGRTAIWDVPSERLLGILDGHRAWPWSVDVDVDGALLTASDDDRAVRWNDDLIDADVASWTAYVCGVVPRHLTVQEWATYLGGEPYEPSCTGTTP